MFRLAHRTYEIIWLTFAKASDNAPASQFGEKIARIEEQKRDCRTSGQRNPHNFGSLR